MLPVSYDPLLVVTSIVVAVMASFTALRLTTGLNALGPGLRKPRIAQAAIALGGGIWSMHFVGMLAIELPIGISYDALPTLLSALLAILITGIGLMVLHFGVRTQARIVLSGTLTGLGIVAMHYIGMQAIRGNCTIQYAGLGVVIAATLAITASIAAFWFAYRRRTLAMTALGAVLLGLAIAAMHYSAMLFTLFRSRDGFAALEAPTLSTGLLALIVSLAAFLICGLFLLNVVPATLTSQPQTLAGPPPDHLSPIMVPPTVPGGWPDGDAVLPNGFPGADPAPASTEVRSRRIPCQRENTIRFFTASHIRAVQADGHYARVIDHEGEHFCPWSFARVEQALSSPPFLRTHRSYLVNLDHVAGFKRDGEKGLCLLDDKRSTEVPVSRSQMANVRQALDLA